jgi:hypothetical protein
MSTFGQFWFWEPWQLLFIFAVAWNVPNLPGINAWYMNSIKQSFKPNAPVVVLMLTRVGVVWGTVMLITLAANVCVALLTFQGAK